MKLWILRNLKPDYDILTASVVRAENEQQARQLLAAESSSLRHNTEMALDVSKVTCEELLVEGDPSVIVTDVEEG